MRIVINKSFGGFSVSEDFCKHYNIPYKNLSGYIAPIGGIERTDKRLIEYIDTYGSEAASGKGSCLVVMEVPKGCLYQIDEYDGCESLYCKDLGNWKIAEY